MQLEYFIILFLVLFCQNLSRILILQNIFDPVGWLIYLVSRPKVVIDLIWETFYSNFPHLQLVMFRTMSTSAISGLEGSVTIKTWKGWLSSEMRTPDVILHGGFTHIDLATDLTRPCIGNGLIILGRNHLFHVLRTISWKRIKKLTMFQILLLELLLRFKRFPKTSFRPWLTWSISYSL